MKKELGKLNFEVMFQRPNEVQHIDLPVEIRRPNLSVVRTGLTSDAMELEPGEYFVISKMPAGQELLAQIEVKAAESSTATLTLDSDEESPHESESLQHFFVANRQKVLWALENSEFTDEIAGKKDRSTVQLRLFSGNLLCGGANQIPVTWLASENEKGLVGFHVPAVDSTPKIAQLVQSGAPPLNVVLPAMAGHDCRLFVTSLVQGKFTPDVHIANTSADILLRYSNKGFFQRPRHLGKL